MQDMDTKKVSVTALVPFYNGKRYIVETLDSLLMQDVSGYDFSIVIVDDCSEEDHASYLRSLILERADSRIFSLRNEKNVGLMKTLNVALRMSEAEYVCVLGQDDLVQPIHLKSMLSIAITSGAPLVFCDAKYIFGDSFTDVFLRGKNIPSGLGVDALGDFRKLSKWNFIVSTGILIDRKKLIDIGGFDEEFKNHGEWATWLKLTRYHGPLFCETVHSYYRRHKLNITNAMFGGEYGLTHKYKMYVLKLAWSLDGTVVGGALACRSFLKNWLIYFYKILRNYLHALKVK